MVNQENAKTSVAGLCVRVGTGLDLPVKQVGEKRAEKLLAVEEEVQVHFLRRYSLGTPPCIR